jgi:hypothetical protein
MPRTSVVELRHDKIVIKTRRRLDVVWLDAAHKMRPAAKDGYQTDTFARQRKTKQKQTNTTNRQAVILSMSKRSDAVN